MKGSPLLRSTNSARKQKTVRRHASAKSIPVATIEKMIEEAIVDAYGESEQVVGFFTILDDKLSLPFETRIFDVDVMVDRIELTPDDRIMAICSRGGSRQRISIVDLPLPTPRPQGAEWIEAYRCWSVGMRG